MVLSNVLSFPRWIAACFGLAVVFALTSPLMAIVSSNGPTGIFDGVNVNQLVGADTFYVQDYWGSRAVIANIEAGYIWNGHEALDQRVSQYFCDPSVVQSTPQYDWHATMVGHVLAGQSPYGPGWSGYYGWSLSGSGQTFDMATFYGIASSAQLWSGAIATGWNPDPNPLNAYGGSFDISAQSMVYAYKKAMQAGIGGQKADVINSSWGGVDPAGTAWETTVIDALVRTNHTTVCLSAGNDGPGAAKVGGPASGYNSISVAAMGPDTASPPYSTVASFSSTGPSDFYNPKTGETIVGVRASVSIAAPGDNMTLAFYGGVTGGHTSGTDPTNGSGQYYIPDMGGTSFSSPIVAGGAALLVDVGRDRFAASAQATDGRVIKAVLLNAATKTAGWNNGQSPVAGVITTTQSLDYAVGAGMLNLQKAFSQYTAGTTDLPDVHGGHVQAIGWDYGEVGWRAANDYYLNGTFHSKDKLTATLDWFIDRRLDEQTLTTSDVLFTDLNLEVWRLQNGLPSQLVGKSASLYNNVEHLYFDLPSDGQYMLRVAWAGEAYHLSDEPFVPEGYAVAWSVVPEPGSVAMLFSAMAAVAVVAARRRISSVRRTRRSPSPKDDRPLRLPIADAAGDLC